MSETSLRTATGRVLGFGRADWGLLLFGLALAGLIIFLI
jgi:hypothetical protein